LPEAIFQLDTSHICTESLGMPRITECRFEKSDGSDIVLDYDLLGKNRKDKATVGPIEDLNPGENRVLIWKK
jgi:hypothetical protein